MRSWSTRAGSCVTTGDGPPALQGGREAVPPAVLRGGRRCWTSAPPACSAGTQQFHNLFFYNGILFTKRICRWLQMSRVRGNVNLTPPFLRPEGADL